MEAVRCMSGMCLQQSAPTTTQITLQTDQPLLRSIYSNRAITITVIIMWHITATSCTSILVQGLLTLLIHQLFICNKYVACNILYNYWLQPSCLGLKRNNTVELHSYIVLSAYIHECAYQYTYVHTRYTIYL